MKNNHQFQNYQRARHGGSFLCLNIKILVGQRMTLPRIEMSKEP